MEEIGKFVTSLVLALFSTIARGFVIMKLWGWFIASTFALPVLDLVQAIGLSLVVGLLTSDLKMDEKGDEWFSEVIIKFFFVIVVYAIVLLEGYIILQFI